MKKHKKKKVVEPVIQKVVKKVKKVVEPEPVPEKVVKKIKKVAEPEPIKEPVKKKKILKSKNREELIPRIPVDYLVLKEDESGNVIIDDEATNELKDMRLQEGSVVKKQVTYYFYEPPTEGWGTGHGYYQHKPDDLMSAIIEAKVRTAQTRKAIGIYQFSECETYLYVRD